MKAPAATILLAVSAVVALANCRTSSPLSGGTKSESPTRETPSIQQVNALLHAINTGHRETIRRFVVERFEPPREGQLPIDETTDRYLALYGSTRGLDLRKVVEISGSEVHALGQARQTDQWIKIQVFFGTAEPATATCKGLPRIAGVGFRMTEMPAELLAADPMGASLAHRGPEMKTPGVL
ncbi:hypothetical protein [Singulisphaera sp. PoT]|uniref:hypothetical protein n=1 Tax=Singulisphaera sp. PoT TaxID=3411797 RepID=UPI003BF56F92